MVVLFERAEAIRQEKGKVVPGVRPLPFDEAGARPVRTRRTSRTIIPNLITLYARRHR